MRGRGMNSLRLTHRSSLLLCDVEEWGIKLGEVALHKVASLVVEGTRLLGVGMPVRLAGEAILRNLGPAVSGTREERPEVIQRRNVTGQATRHADDGDGGRLSTIAL